MAFKPTIWISCLSLMLFGCDPKPLDEPFATRFHAQLTESSGLAQHPAYPSHWFTHNDSGGNPVLYAFDLESDAVLKHSISGAEAEDWEDIAAGPCPESAQPCLFVGDIGDNAERRKRVQLYAIRLSDGGIPDAVIATWHVRYPTGAKNAEALLVHPKTGDITIVTKHKEGRSDVFRVPRTPGKVQATQVGRLQIEGDERGDRLITGGDWSPEGDRVVLRTYNAAYEWVVEPNDRDAHWRTAPRQIALPVEKQGEAISYLPNGDLITSSEGKPMTLQVIRRRTD